MQEIQKQVQKEKENNAVRKENNGIERENSLIRKGDNVTGKEDNERNTQIGTERLDKKRGRNKKR